MNWYWQLNISWAHVAVISFMMYIGIINPFNSLLTSWKTREIVSEKWVNNLLCWFATFILPHCGDFHCIKMKFNFWWHPWALIQYKKLSNQYRKSHRSDKMVIWSSYLHKGIFFTSMKISLYWIRAMGFLANKGWWKELKDRAKHNLHFFWKVINMELKQ